MKCAYCSQDPTNKCDKDGQDCTAGLLVLAEYDELENQPFHRISGKFQAEYGNSLTRMEEMMKFAQEMQYNKLGLAFCVGLAEEAGVISRILENNGFTVSSVCCKVCGLDKKNYDVPNVKPDKFEALCNPLAQARILNNSKTDMNVALGLCVGHDMLFQKYSEAPVTTLVVKDRVLAHNPLGIVYSSYYRKKFKV